MCSSVTLFVDQHRANEDSSQATSYGRGKLGWVVLVQGRCLVFVTGPGLQDQLRQVFLQSQCAKP
jgi:hypothetical protein